MITKFDAVRSLVEGSFSMTSDDSDVQYLDGQTPPSDEAITTEVARLQAEYDAQAYARSRKTEYPTIEECVHAILDDDLDALQVLRQAVKDKYPK